MSIGIVGTVASAIARLGFFESTTSTLIVTFVVGIVIAGIIWHFARSRQILERWAVAHGYHLLKSEYRSFYRGPYFFASSRGQPVYFVKLSDRGTIRQAWVRCGSWWLGLRKEKVEVRWEETTSQG